MMKYVISGLTLLLIYIVVNGILGYLKQPKQAENGKVHFPKFFIILGMITFVAFLIPTVITAFLDIPLLVPVIFLLFSLLGMSLIVAFINCRISYDQNGFVHKSFFGIKRQFTYDQVTAIKENAHEKYIYVGKKRLMVDELLIGGNDFIKFVKKEYRALREENHSIEN